MAHLLWVSFCFYLPSFFLCSSSLSLLASPSLFLSCSFGFFQPFFSLTPSRSPLPFFFSLSGSQLADELKKRVASLDEDCRMLKERIAELERERDKLRERVRVADAERDDAKKVVDTQKVNLGKFFCVVVVFATFSRFFCNFFRFCVFLLFWSFQFFLLDFCFNFCPSLSLICIASPLFFSLPLFSSFSPLLSDRVEAELTQTKSLLANKRKKSKLLSEQKKKAEEDAESFQRYIFLSFSLAPSLLSTHLCSSSPPHSSPSPLFAVSVCFYLTTSFCVFQESSSVHT